MEYVDSCHPSLRSREIVDEACERASKVGREKGWQLAINPYIEADAAAETLVERVCDDCEGSGFGKTPETTSDRIEDGGMCTTCDGSGLDLREVWLYD